MTDLRTRLRAAYDRCSSFPEVSRNTDGTFTVKGDAYMALLEMRSLWSELDSALFELEQAREYVAVPRLEG